MTQDSRRPAGPHNGSEGDPQDESFQGAPNELAEDFTATAPNRKWVTDITYLATAEGWVVVLDLFSRKVVGWALSNSLATELVSEALRQAVEVRRPEGRHLLHHSDTGCIQSVCIRRSATCPQINSEPNTLRHQRRKLPPAGLRESWGIAKWIIKPFSFEQFEGDGRPTDNWPNYERPTDQEPAELRVPFNVVAKNSSKDQ